MTAALPLTDRQVALLLALGGGLTLEQAALQLGITPRVARRERERARRVLGAASTTQMAFAVGFVEGLRVGAGLRR